MPEIQVADTTVVIEPSSYMYGLIDFNIRSHDPTATLTSTQARRVASALLEAANEADGIEEAV